MHHHPTTRTSSKRIAVASALVALLAVAVGLSALGSGPLESASGGTGVVPVAGRTPSAPGGSAESAAPAAVGPTGAPSAGSSGLPTVAPSAGPPSPTPLASDPAAVPTGPAPSVLPSPSPTPALEPPPAPGPFEINLYERGDFVSQATKYYCVPAAMQTMVNIMSPGADRTRATQDRLYRLARKLSPKTLVGKGAEPEGWARSLTQLGFGGYRVDVQKTRAAAIRVAARALRATGRPVGLLTWWGAHSWVMSGFKATADPAWTDDFQVTDVFIEDVWYPRISSIWGPSLPPNALMTVKSLRVDYIGWRRPTRRYPDKDGRFVLVIPIESPAPTR